MTAMYGKSPGRVPGSLTRLRWALACGMLATAVAYAGLSDWDGDLMRSLGPLLLVTAAYAALMLNARRAPRVVAAVSLLFGTGGLQEWHGLTHTLVALLSAIEALLALSVLLASRPRSSAPAS